MKINQVPLLYFINSFLTASLSLSEWHTSIVAALTIWLGQYSSPFVVSLRINSACSASSILSVLSLAPTRFSNVKSERQFSFSVLLTSSSFNQACCALGHSRTLCLIVSMGSGQLEHFGLSLRPNLNSLEFEKISPCTRWAWGLKPVCQWGSGCSTGISVPGY